MLISRIKNGDRVSLILNGQNIGSINFTKANNIVEAGFDIPANVKIIKTQICNEDQKKDAIRN